MKVEEVKKYFFNNFIQFRDEIKKNKELGNNVNKKEKKCNNSYFKNDLEEIKNNFVKIKSMIAQKRKPEENLQNILEKIDEKNNSYENDKTNGNFLDKSVNNENELKEKGKIFNINKAKKSNKRIKKIINKDKLKSNHINKKYKKNENINIDYFFDKRDINQNENNMDNNLMKLKIKKDKNNDKKNIIIENAKGFILKIREELNKKNNFSIIEGNKFKYDTTFLNSIKNIPSEIKDFYSLNSNSINVKNKFKYLSILKKYILKYNSMIDINKYNNDASKKKLIYIHSSLIQLKKIPKKMSTKINPRNYLEKDEYLIDYEKDSDDEYLEENAEDIKSNDDEKEDDEEIYSVSQRDGREFIVPDGYLSQDELSDIEILEERKKFQKNKNKLINIKTFLNIRKSYIKPIIIDFTKNSKDEKIKILASKLTVGLFSFEIYNITNFNYDELNLIKGKFPIAINNKEKKGVHKDPIKNHFVEIFKIIHGSYDTKEHLISEINKKYEDISKNLLNNFFKEKCIKISKKYWLIKNDVLIQFNQNEKVTEEIKNQNYKIYKEKKEQKEKDLKGIKLKEELLRTSPKNNNKKICNEPDDYEKKKNIFDISKSQRLDKIFIEPNEFEEISIEILDDNSCENKEVEEVEKEEKQDIIIDIDTEKSKENEEESIIINPEKTRNISNNRRRKKQKKKKLKNNNDEEDNDESIFSLDIKNNTNKIINSAKISKLSDFSKVSKLNQTGKMSKIQKERKYSNKPKSRSIGKKKYDNNKLINEYFFIIKSEEKNV